MWAVKIEFDTATSLRTGTKVFPFETREKAVAFFHARIFDWDEARPMPVKGTSKTVDIINAWLYCTVANTPVAAIAEVESGQAVLVDLADDEGSN